VRQVIRSGTLLIQKGTTLPDSILFQGDATANDWSTVEGGAELLHLKKEIAAAGWNYFYMGAVKQTVFGRGPKRTASAIKGLTAKMRLNKCNSLQIDAIAQHSWLRIPYLSVSAHCCHIQKDVIFTGEKP
jgi:hypothetical protein